ncbi:MAG TPA: BON domain-containing protein [Pyrinomonadaceae bacterium]|nr:BON domain-containing protein [Pyrinomonadaceae bacterium]
MATRYEDRDNERGRRNFGRRSGREDDRAYNQSGRSGAERGFEDERDRYSAESRWRGQSEERTPYRSGSDYQSSREDYGDQGWESDYSNRGYGSAVPGRSYGDYGLGYGGIQGGYGRGERGFGGSIGSGGAERGYSGSERGYSGGERGGRERGEGERGRYSDTSSGYGQRYNYPTGSRSSERFGERDRGYEYGRGEYGGDERGWWDRASDEVASWFGDEEAERRRRMDEQRPHRGKGPKGYRRSDERIKEDVNDRLSEGYLDATEIMVAVENGEVTLTGTVNSRADKRRAEDIAEYVSGVSNVENRLRVKDATGRYSSSQTTGVTDTSTTSSGAGATGTGTGTTGTATGASATGAATSTGTAARGKTTSS